MLKSPTLNGEAHLLELLLSSTTYKYNYTIVQLQLYEVTDNNSYIIMTKDDNSMQGKNKVIHRYDTGVTMGWRTQQNMCENLSRFWLQLKLHVPAMH